MGNVYEERCQEREEHKQRHEKKGFGGIIHQFSGRQVRNTLRGGVRWPRNGVVNARSLDLIVWIVKILG